MLMEISTKELVGAGAVVLTGLLVTGIFFHGKGYDEGYKDGCVDTSIGYEAKFKALSEESRKSQGIISEQRRLLREADVLIADMSAYINICRAGGITLEPEIERTYIKASALRDDLRRRAA